MLGTQTRYPYSYQATKKRSSRTRGTIQFKSRTFTALSGQSWSRKSTSTPLLAQSTEQSRQVLFLMGDIKTRSAHHHSASCFTPVLSNYNLIIVVSWKNVRLVNKQAGKRFSGVGRFQETTKSTFVSCNYPEGSNGWPLRYFTVSNVARQISRQETDERSQRDIRAVQKLARNVKNVSSCHPQQGSGGGL